MNAGKTGKMWNCKNQVVHEKIRQSTKQRACSKCCQSGHSMHTCKRANVGCSSKGVQSGGTNGEQMGGQQKGIRGKAHVEGTGTNQHRKSRTKKTHGPKAASVINKSSINCTHPPAADTRSVRAAAATSSV